MDSYDFALECEREMWDAIVSNERHSQRWDRVTTEDCPNPVVKVTRLRAYRGFVVREYQDGMFDATDNNSLSPGFDSFREAVAWVRSQA